jgi:hypothetical protein
MFDTDGMLGFLPSFFCALYWFYLLLSSFTPCLEILRLEMIMSPVPKDISHPLHLWHFAQYAIEQFT